MKKITLLVASIFLAGSMAYASKNPVFSDNNGKGKGPKHWVHYKDAEPISFVERGIEFFVFPNGDFDFNTRPDDVQGSDYYFRAAGKRGSVVVTSRNPVNYGVRIERDSFGRVRRVGNTFINYDYNDRVSRIGTVYMKYNSFALTQIGGLRIVYNRKCQIVDMIGDVKRNSGGGYYYENSNTPRGGHDHDNDDYYYYKIDGTKAKVESVEDRNKR